MGAKFGPARTDFMTNGRLVVEALSGRDQALLSRSLFVMLTIFTATTVGAEQTTGGPKPSAGQGQANSSSASSSSASDANNPSSPLLQLQIQDWYSPSLDGLGSRGKDENLLLLRPVIPVPASGGIPPEIIRFQIPIVTTPDNQTNLGDISGFDLFFFSLNKQIKLGLGPAFSLPTDTYHLAGAGKWALGPGAALIYANPKGLLLAALVQNPISFAGHRNTPGLNTLTFQPFIVQTLPRGFFVRFDPIWEFDWTHGGAATMPLNFGFGRVFKIGPQEVNMYIEPEWNVVRPDDNRIVPRFTLRFAVHLLFPQKK